MQKYVYKIQLLVCLFFSLSQSLFAKYQEPHFQLNPQEHYQINQLTWQDNFSATIKQSSYPQEFCEQIPLTYIDFVRAKIESNDFCQKRYGMSSQQLRQLLKTEYAMIVAQLLECKHLSNVGIAELWMLYKSGCCRTGKVKKCEEDLLKELQQRVKISTVGAQSSDLDPRNQKLQVAQSLDADLKDYNKKIETCSEKINDSTVVLHRDVEFLQKQYKISEKYLCYGIDSKIFEERDKALQKTINQNYQQYKQRYGLDAQTEGYLLSQGLSLADYRYCFGTALQQQLHGEICTLIGQVAQKPTVYAFPIEIANFSDAACEQNKQEQIQIATTLADIAWTLTGVPLGIYESAKDTILLPLHVPEIIKGLGQAIYFVVETVAIIDHAVHSNSNKATQAFDERSRLIKQGIIQAATQYANASAHDKVKGTTRLIADFIVPGKVFHAVGHLFAGVATQSKKLRNLEYVASIMDHELGFEKIVEEVLEISKVLEPATLEGFKAQALVECMEAENGVEKVIHLAPRSLKMIIEEIRSLGGVIPFHRRDLKQELGLILKELQQGLKNPTIEKLKHLYGRKTIENKQVNLFLEHIFEFEFKLKDQKALGGYVLELKGGHVATVWEHLESVGLVQILDKEILPNKAINYMIKDLVTGKQMTKTVFPSHWTAEKITQSIWEVYERGVDKITDKGNHYKYKQIDADFTMSILLVHIDNSSNANRNITNIITALPYWNIK